MRRPAARGFALLGVAIAGAALAAFAGPNSEPSFDATWHDGRAEVDGYRLAISRYGAPRVGRCVAIYVTEPFSASRRVKLDDPARHPDDVVDVLKLNLVRAFQTGIYDYHTMVSRFGSTRDFEALKVSFTSSEWCGNVYEELRFDPASVTDRVSSYFEGESGERVLEHPRAGIDEDALFVLLRGLREPWLAPRETRRVPFLPSPFVRRLRHQPAAWGWATVTRRAGGAWLTTPAGRFAVDRWDVATSDGRAGVFHVERAAPRRIVRWQWARPAGAGFMGATETAWLVGSHRLAYWKLNAPGGEVYLDSLGMAKGAP